MAVLGSPVRVGAEAVATGAIVENPVTAGFDAGAGSLGELHFDGIIAGGDSGDLSDGEGLAPSLTAGFLNSATMRFTSSKWLPFNESAAISQFSGSAFFMQKSLLWAFSIAPSIVVLIERTEIEMIRRAGRREKLRLDY
nr:hypothetical protein Itr_chr04CG13110 [Ipomoea trifida]